MYYIRYPLSFRQVEDILHERGVDICHETVRFWVERFGSKFAREIRKNRAGQHSNWQWHLDEVFVKINGERFYLWRAVDHEGEVLECFVTKRRNKAAAKKFLIKTMRKHGSPKIITTDKLASYGAAFREIGVVDRQLCGGRANNRCENSHLPFRRRERAMQTFRRRLQAILQAKTYSCSHRVVQFLCRMMIDLRCLLRVFKFAWQHPQFVFSSRHRLDR